MAINKFTGKPRLPIKRPAPGLMYAVTVNAICKHAFDEAEPYSPDELRELASRVHKSKKSNQTQEN